MGTGGSFSGIKRSRREADHSPPSSAEVECVELYPHSPIYLHWVVISKHRDNFIFIYTFYLIL